MNAHTNEIAALNIAVGKIQMDIENLQKWKNSQPMQDAAMSHMRIGGIIPELTSASGFKIGLEQTPLTPIGERIAELEAENKRLKDRSAEITILANNAHHRISDITAENAELLKDDVQRDKDMSAILRLNKELSDWRTNAILTNELQTGRVNSIEAENAEMRKVLRMVVKMRGLKNTMCPDGFSLAQNKARALLDNERNDK